MQWIVSLTPEVGHDLLESIKTPPPEAAVVEGDRVKASAQSDIDQEINRAREQLRGQVATLALAGAEKVLGAAIDREAHADLVDKLASEL